MSTARRALQQCLASSKKNWQLQPSSILRAFPTQSYYALSSDRHFCRSSQNKDTRSSDDEKGSRKDPADGKPEEVKEAERPQAGDPVLFGAAGGAAVFGVLRLLMRRGVVLAPGLQFLPAVPVLLGIVEDVRRGGWGLLWVVVPFTGASAVGLNSMQEQRRRTHLLDQATAELQAACPDLPAQTLTAFRAAKATEYESNRLMAEVEWPAAGSEACPNHWKLEVRAERSIGWESWSLKSLKLSTAPRDRLGLAEGVPPPQTRHWDKPQLSWKVIWERS